MQSCALYIHVPFCERKCPYCGFASVAPGDDRAVSDYIAVLLREAGHYSTMPPWSDMEVHSIYLGGGTPSLLSTDQVETLLGGVRELYHIQPDAEVTLECNPGTVDHRKAEAWLRSGINRVSLGVQSLDDIILQFLGRIHTADDARKSWELLRETGFTNLGVDLIRSWTQTVTGQSFDATLTWRLTLEEVLGWEPEHLSIYSLSIEEGTPFAADELHGVPRKISEKEEVTQFRFTCKLLDQADYEHYEISNWAKPGRHSRHNLSYWNGSPYLALGPSGHSFDPQGKRRSWNHREVPDWSRAVQETGSGELDGEVLTPVHEFEELVILGLRLTAGVEEERLAAAARNAGRTWPPKVLPELLNKGCLERADGRLRYTQQGLLLADTMEVMLAG